MGILLALQLTCGVPTGYHELYNGDNEFCIFDACVHSEENHWKGLSKKLAARNGKHTHTCALSQWY